MIRLLLALVFLLVPGCYTVRVPCNGAKLEFQVSTRTKSMWPTFKGGEIVNVERVPFDKIRNGDIIIYSKPLNYSSDYVIHRVTARERESLICKGDNNPKSDRLPIFEEEYIGKVMSWLIR